MHIVHVIWNLGCGGAEQLLYDFLRNANTVNHRHSVVYFRPGNHVENIKKLGIPTYEIKGLFFAWDLFSFMRFYKCIKKLQPDVIHASLWAAHIFSRLVGKQLQIPVIVSMHGNFTHHGMVRNILDRLTAHIPFKYIAVSSQVKDSFRNEIVAKIVDKQKARKILQRVHVIPNGIDAQQVRHDALQSPLQRNEIGLALDDFVIGSLGRLTAIKSYHTMLRAFALAFAVTPCLKLVLVGGGPEEKNLKKLAHELGLDSAVIFTGFRSDARRFYPLFDCFALSSQSEGLSIALLEALSFGLPVITTHAGGRHEVITNAQNGLLVGIDNERALARAFIKLVEGRSFAKSLGERGKKVVEEHFSLARMVESYEALYKEIGIKNSIITKKYPL